MTIPRDLAGQMSDLYARVGDMERRARNRKRTGRVSALDLANGLARVEFQTDGDQPYVGPWMPWKEVAAGGIKSHIPPTVGEQVDVVSENGDLTDGIIDMSTPSNDNPRPHDGPEAVITMGGVRVMLGGEAVTITAPNVVVNSPNVQLGGDGGKAVARIGDMVNVGSGSSSGMWPIVQGSGSVFAAG